MYIVQLIFEFEQDYFFLLPVLTAIKKNYKILYIN